MEPIAQRARAAARRTSPERAHLLREYARDLGVLMQLPALGPRLLGFIDRECRTVDDWQQAARSAAARYGLNLQMRDQLTLRIEP